MRYWTLSHVLLAVKDLETGSPTHKYLYKKVGSPAKILQAGNTTFLKIATYI